MNPKLFVKDRIVPEYLIEDIVYDLEDVKGVESAIVSGVVKQARSSTTKRLKPNRYADLSNILENFCPRIHPKHDPKSLKLGEIEYLKYGVWDHFRAHTDDVPNDDPRGIRRFTTITLISKAEDLIGGDLLIFDKDENPINTNLEVGETVVFYSSCLHQVNPIKRGGREVLVGWIYDR